MRIEFNDHIGWIRLLYPKVYLDRFGYSLEVTPFETYGYFATRGVADMLPKYYSVLFDESGSNN